MAWVGVHLAKAQVQLCSTPCTLYITYGLTWGLARFVQLLVSDIVIPAVHVEITMDGELPCEKCIPAKILILIVYDRSSPDSNDNDLAQHGHLHLGLDTLAALILVG